MCELSNVETLQGARQQRLQRVRGACLGQDAEPGRRVGRRRIVGGVTGGIAATSDASFASLKLGRTTG